MPHPMAPQGLVPALASGGSSSDSGSGGSISGLGQESVASRNLLSARFRYKAIDDLEIEEIMSGGATVVF